MEIVVEAILKRSPEGLGIDIDQSNVITRLVEGSPASIEGTLRLGDCIVALDGVPLGTRHITEVMDFQQTSYHLSARRSEGTPVEPLVGLMNTIQLRALKDEGALPEGVHPEIQYFNFSGRQLDKRVQIERVSRVERTGVNALQSWNLGEIESTLQRTLLGQRKQPTSSVQRTPKSSDAKGGDLFGEIDAMVATLPRPSEEASASPLAASPFVLDLKSPLANQPAATPLPLVLQPSMPAKPDAGNMTTLPRGVSPNVNANEGADAAEADCGGVSARVDETWQQINSSPSSKSGGHPSNGREGVEMTQQLALDKQVEVTLGEQIGKGTYGSVYKADMGGKVVAVKLLPLLGGNAAEVMAEIRMLQRCTCDSIVGYYDAFLRENQGVKLLWIVMEYCELGSALHLIQQAGSPLTEEQVARICKGVIDGLEYMHNDLKAIHRDVKAANVLLTTDGGVRLADLGVAAQLFSTMSKRGTMIGTPHWMAPEALAASGGGDYDSRVDIWALGITAIEMRQGAPPYAEIKQLFQVIIKIATGPPPALSDEIAASRLFRDFVAATLIKDPSERPAAAIIRKHEFIKFAPPDALSNLVRKLSTASSNAPPGNYYWDTCGSTLAV